MELFRRGIIRILVCTDAAGMGCNIPDIDIVVQWKSTNSIETFHQRAGRVARKKSRKGIAVLLAEPNAYKVDPTEPANPNNTQTKYKGRPSRGTKKKSSDLQSAEIEIRDNSPGGGIYAFIQTTSCRRAILTRVFENPAPVLASGVPCCDICDPSVLAQVRVPPPEKKRRVVLAKNRRCNMKTVETLVAWREKICERDFSYLQWAPNAFLDDQTIHSIASRPDVVTGQQLATLLKNDWGYWGRYGGELLAHLKQESATSASLSEASQVDASANTRPNTTTPAQRGSKKNPTSIHREALRPNEKEASPRTPGKRDRSQAPKIADSSEVEERPTSGKKPRQSIDGARASNFADDGLFHIAPASPRSQWRVSTTPMLPAHMTPVVPSQKRTNSPDPAQSVPRKLRFDPCTS